MTDHWYCLDCDRRIDADDRSRHAAADHRLRGIPTPNRTLSAAIQRFDPDETALRRFDPGETALRPVREPDTRLARRREG